MNTAWSRQPENAAMLESLIRRMVVLRYAYWPILLIAMPGCMISLTVFEAPGSERSLVSQLLFWLIFLMPWVCALSLLGTAVLAKEKYPSVWLLCAVLPIVLAVLGSLVVVGGTWEKVE